MVRRQAFFLLKSSHYNAWRNSHTACKPLNLFLCRIRWRYTVRRRGASPLPTGYKLLPPHRINQSICGEQISLILFSFPIFLIYFPIVDPHSMSYNMTSLVEKGQPELILGFITQAKLYQRLRRLYPVYCTTHTHIGDLRHKNHGHTSIGTQTHQCFLPHTF